MPETDFVDAPQPTQPHEFKSTNWPRIILAAVVGLGLLAGAAYTGYWYGTRQVQQIERSTDDSTFQIEMNPMIGGGIMGAVRVYLINSAGEVYGISSPAWNVSPKRELIKRIDRETVESLRDSLIEANIFEMEEGVPTYSGESWRVIINRQEKTVYFVETPNNLLNTEKILKEILGL